MAGQRVHVTVLVDVSTFMLLQATFGPLLPPHFGCKAAMGQLNDHHCAFEGVGIDMNVVLLARETTGVLLVMDIDDLRHNVYSISGLLDTCAQRQR